MKAMSATLVFEGYVMTHSATARLFLKLNSQYSALCGLILLALCRR